MAFSNIRDLKLYTPSLPIKLRIQRKWRSITPSDPDRLLSVDLLASDSNGDVAHCRISTFDAPLFEDRISEGHMYIFSQFNVSEPKRIYNVIRKDFMIGFRRTTIVEEIDEDLTPYPAYHFNFVEYSVLSARIWKVDYFSDVIGVVTSMTSISTFRYANANEDMEKREIQVKNKAGQTLKVVVYGEDAHRYTRETIESKTDHIVLICAAMLIKSFQGELFASACSASKIFLDLDIPETTELKDSYKGRPIEFQYRELGQTVEASRNAEPPKLTTIEALYNIKPSECKGIRFMIEVLVKDVFAPRGWYYNACSQCSVGLRQEDDYFICNEHGKKDPHLTCRLTLSLADETGQLEIVAFGKQAEKLIGRTVEELLAVASPDMLTLPPPIMQLIGQRRKLVITLTARAVDTDTFNFKLTDCDEAMSKKRRINQTPTSPKTSLTLEGPGGTSTSPISKEVARELFPAETPMKQPKLKEKEPEQ